MTVNIDTYTEQVAPTVSIDKLDENLPVNSDVAKVRAFKAAYGIQTISPDKKEKDLNNAMVSGYEGVMRKEIANDQDKQNADVNMSYLQNLSTRPEVTSDDFQKAVENLDVQSQIKTDPQTVIEKAFAKRYVDSANDAIVRNYVPNRQQSLSEAFADVKPGTSNLIEKQQYLRKWAQDINDQDVKNQSTLGYVLDFAKTMVQPYNEYKQRGIVPGVGFFEGPMGYNLKQQGMTLWRLPLPDMIRTLTPTINQMRKDNPQLAAQYLSSLAGMSGEDEVVNNLFTFMMPLDWVGAGSAGARAAGKSIQVDTMTGKVLESRTKVNVAGRVKGAAYTPDELEGLGVSPERPANGVKYTPDELEALGVPPARVQAAAKEMVKATAEEPVTPATLASGTGDSVEAGIKRASETIDAKLTGELDPNQEVRQGAEQLYSAARIDKIDIENNAGSRGGDFTTRLLQAYDRWSSSVQDAILNRKLVDKLPGVFESEDAMRQLAARIQDSGEYRGLSASVSDVEFKHDRISNTHSYDIVLRQPDGNPWFSEAEARGWARLNGLPQKSLTVETDGLMGFKIKMNKPLKETDSILQNLLMPTEHTKDPEGLLRSWIGWALNPDETLSAAHRENRKIATYGPSWLMSHMAADAKILKSFARGAIQVNPITGATEMRKFSGMRQRWQDWERMVKAMRMEPDPDKPEQMGRWMKGPGEIEDYYDTHYHRMPEEAEVHAYFAYKRINEYDRILRDLRYYSNMWREGVQDHSFSYTDKSGQLKDLSFKGNQITHIPRDGESVLYIADKNNEKSFKKYDAGRYGAQLKFLEDGLADGSHKVYKIWNPDEHEFLGVGPINTEHWTQYVIVKGGAESTNIPFNLLPRRGGGHWDVDHPYYMSQPIFYADRPTTAAGKKGFRMVYAGDRTIMPIQIRAMGQKVADHLNQIRIALKGKDEVAAQAYHAAHAAEIGIPYGKLRGWFESGKDSAGRTLKPMLSKDHDIQIRPKDVQLIDMNKNYEKEFARTNTPFLDGTKRGNPSRQAQVQYSGMRDSNEVFTLNDKGSRYNPLYEYEPATFLDPIETMNRALTRITQSTYLEDYKQFAVSHWFKKASEHLNLEDKEIAAAPYHHFYQPIWKTGTTEETKRILMAQNNNIRQFLGVSNPTDKLVKESTQKMIDQIYGKYGPNAVKLVPNWMLGGMTDPINFVKQITYHAALGLFSIPQLVVQMQTYALIMALSPRAAVSGSYAALLHQWTRMNPGMLSHLDSTATKLRIPGFHAFEIGEFQEAHKLGYQTGFFDVQGEHAMIDNIMNGNKLVTGLGRDFLDWGTMPFRGGERHVRIGAWYTAFKEFRVEHPTGRITEKDARTILNRADDLYGNMSRASSSQLHTGILSIPTQFLSYQIRLAELFLGSRTSRADKGRMFATFAALYGVPMAVGLTGVPLGDYIKRKSIEEGYVVGDNWITTMLQEGIPSVFVALMTGGGDLSKGNFYNFGERFASNGMDIFRGDKTMWDVLGGASFSKAKGLLDSVSPFWQVMMSAVRDDDKAFPITMYDFINPLRELSSANNIAGTLATLQTGRVMSKKGIYLDDASPMSAFFMALTGLKTTRSVDAQYMSITLKERDEYEKATVKKFEGEFKQGLRLAANNQLEESKDYMKRAFVYLWLSGAREDELTGILSRASSDNQSLVDQIDWSYYVKNAPDYAKSQMYDAFARKLKVTGK